MFQFQQFTIHDDRCAMKVGTDGVLLGAWVELGDARRVIDVGCGSGLVALMLAQRFPDVQVVGIEIDEDAAEQAEENIKASPFAKQIEVHAADFFQMDLDEASVDAIVSNPPFFQETLVSPDAQRATARHATDGFTFPEFVKESARLLCEGGSLQVILPTSAKDAFHQECNLHNLVLERQTMVKTVERKAPKRVLLHFRKSLRTVPVTHTELTLSRDGVRSEEYTTLCRDFYL